MTEIRVPITVFHERYDTCRQCDQSEARGTELVCKVCDCLILGMSRLKEKECPLNKWGKFEDQ